MQSKIVLFNPKGFTLIELLVVIAIIGVLSSIVLAAVNTAEEKSRDARREEDLSQLQTALEAYANDHNGVYPIGSGIPRAEANCPASKVSAAGWQSSSGYTGPTAWIPNLAPTYISTLPGDPLVNSNSGWVCYTYFSNSAGTGYFIWAHNGEEVGSSNDVSNPIIREDAPGCTVLENTYTVYGGELNGSPVTRCS